MTYTETQKEYLKNQFYKGGGSDNTILKSDIINFAKSLGLDFKKNASKDNILDLIYYTDNEDKLYEAFGESIHVPFYDVAKLNGITYKQLSDLEQYEILKSLDFTGYKGATLYPLSSLAFDDGELLNIWTDKNKTDFHRTRIEIKNENEATTIIKQISKIFEVENVSKLYPHREYSGYYIYFSIRSLDGTITNDNFKNTENAKLKLENSYLKSKIQELENTIYQISIDSRNSPEYLSLKERYNLQKEKIINAEINESKIRMLENKIASLEAQQKENINNINTSKINAPTSGRPPRFNDQERETIKMYRLQGKSIRAIAEIFNCSTGLVHKILNS